MVIYRLGGKNIAKKALAFTFLVVFALFASMLLLLQNFSTVGASQVRVACVGDSITAGSGYPELLQAMLGENYSVGNFGVTGLAVAPHADSPRLSLATFRSAMTFEPTVVVIMLGTNDANQTNKQSIENFTANYKKIVSTFQSLGTSPQIYLVEPPPIGNNTVGLSDKVLVEDVLPRIEQIASEHGLPTIDLHDALANSTDCFGDGVHPNSEAAQIIAEEINQALISNGYQDDADPNTP